MTVVTQTVSSLVFGVHFVLNYYSFVIIAVVMLVILRAKMNVCGCCSAFWLHVVSFRVLVHN